VNSSVRLASFRVQGSTFVVSNAELEELIRYAFELSRYDSLENAPAWKRDRFDITAKTSDGITLTTALSRRLLRELLHQRFQLELSFRARDVTGYALRLDKQDGTCGGTRFRGGDRRDGGLLEGACSPLSHLTRFLSLVLQAPIDDQTGLTGRLDFTLTYGRAPMAADASLGLPAISVADYQQNIIDAVVDQLGLHLRSSRVPARVAVVERVEPPSDN
jgi:uncharacterized protein (TIGR03435 family)